MTNSRQTIGQRGEDMVTERLLQKGYTILGRNWRFHGLGELDIIAQAPNTREIVFVEVRARRGTRQAALDWALDSVHARKQERLLALAQAYLNENQMDNAPWRIDVAAVAFTGDKVVVEIISNAVEW